MVSKSASGDCNEFVCDIATLACQRLLQERLFVLSFLSVIVFVHKIDWDSLCHDNARHLDSHFLEISRQTGAGSRLSRDGIDDLDSSVTAKDRCGVQVHP